MKVLQLCFFFPNAANEISIVLLMFGEHMLQFVPEEFDFSFQRPDFIGVHVFTSDDEMK